jgi:hypothetical protein
MGINVTQTTAPPSAIAAELTARFDDPAVVIYFASSATDFRGVAMAIAEAFPRAATFGCTTAGELISGAMGKGSIVAMGIGREFVTRTLVAVVDGVSASVDGVRAAVAGFEHEVGAAMRELDHDRWIGLVLVDGMSGAEERLMGELGSLTDVAFVGGSAGDDLAFKTTLVAAAGEARSDAAVLALLECPNGFDLLKTQSFVATGKTLIPTRVDRDTRTVLEFDGRSAADAYADAVGVPVDRLTEQFMANPLGLMVDGSPYVRSPQQLVGQAVKFYCAVDEGVPLALLESDDIVAHTRRDLAACVARSGEPAGIVNFNCILRTLELEAEGQTDAYAMLFEQTPTIGFSTYGEEFGRHINQTATMLLLR